jgi:hypothetical protein
MYKYKKQVNKINQSLKNIEYGIGVHTTNKWVGEIF